MKAINDQISVSPQIMLSEIETIKAQGFDVVMSNRPDGEEPGQVMTGDIQAAVEAAGMRFVHIPIVSGQFTQEAVDGFKAVLESGERVFAYCRSGTRCAGLWALSQKGEQTADEILSQTSAAGYEFPQLRGYLEQN